jgi:protein disulfide-isomerase A1
LASKHKLLLAYFGDDTTSKEHKTYLEVASHGSVAEKFHFVHILDKECSSKHGASAHPSVVIFRQFDQSPLHFDGKWETQHIVDWMVSSSVPTLIEFSEDYIEPIFGQKQPAIFLFRSKEDATSSFANVFSDAANQLKGQILFVVSGVTDGIQSRLAEFIGVDGSHIPTIKLLDPNDNMKKYQYAGSTKDITVEQIKSFINDFKSGKITPFLKSEEIPADNSQPVKVIVGKQFADMVINNDDDVLVKFYAPWCGHCKKLAPIWDEVAEELKDVPHLVISKFDATANEVEGVDIRGYPTLKFYPKGGKSSPVDFEGERDKEGIKTWLKEHSFHYKHYLEQKSEL